MQLLMHPPWGLSPRKMSLTREARGLIILLRGDYYLVYLLNSRWFGELFDFFFLLFSMSDK